MDRRTIQPDAPRSLPPLTDENRAFWTGGAHGQLLIQRCQSCERWVHPPVAACPACDGELRPEPVQGTGTIFTFTENVHAFNPDVPTPYVIAVVVLDEQDDLRLPTNIVHADAASLEIGQRVQVLFEHDGEVYVPLFEPISGGG